MQATENLVRKQYLVAPQHVKKVEGLAKERNVSSAEIIRMAIDAFHPDTPLGMKEDELFQLVSTRLKDAIEDTKKTRRKVRNAIAKIERVK